MASLKDIAPLSSSVELRGSPFSVYPLSLAQIGALVARFKGLASILDGGDLISAILSEGDAAVAAVVAAALRQPEEDVHAAGLTAAEQAEVILACVELTLPSSDEALGNFMKRLAALLNRVGTTVGRS